MTDKELKVLYGKVSYTQALVDYVINKMKNDLTEDYAGVIWVMFFNKPKLYYAIKNAFKNAIVYYIERSEHKDWYGVEEQNSIYLDFSKGEYYPNMNLKDVYIIANPPYAIGNAITKAVVDNVDFKQYINLMPLSKYKSKELYKHVDTLELADPSCFKDATITDNLCVCELTKSEKNTSYDDLALETYDPQYREFYKLNLKLCNRYMMGYHNKFSYGKVLNELKVNNEIWFAYTERTVQNGTHKLGGSAWDIEWNLNHGTFIPRPHVNENAEDYSAQAMFLWVKMPSAQAKNNLCTFWYKNPLMSLLLWGLHSTSGSCEPAIPNIDYSKDRDYEHLTLDDIMQILREENPDVVE